MVSNCSCNYSNDGGNSWHWLADVDSSDRWERQYLIALQNFDNVVLAFIATIMAVGFRLDN